MACARHRFDDYIFPKKYRVEASIIDQLRDSAPDLEKYKAMQILPM